MFELFLSKKQNKMSTVQLYKKSEIKQDNVLGQIFFLKFQKVVKHI